MGTDASATRDALEAGLSLVRRAVHDAPAPLAVSAAGWTAVFVAGRGGLPPEAAAALAWTGLALVLLMAAPKLGALHRLAAGDAARDPPGPAGLQWTALEGRLAATATALAAAGAILFAALGGVAAAALAALRPPGRIEAGPLGRLDAGALLLSPALVAAALLAAGAVGRLCVTLAADAAEPRPRFARGWLLTRGAGAAPAAAWLLTFALPSAALLVLPAVLDALGVLGAGGGRWALGEAVGTGAGLALATQFLAAPMNAGALAQLRRAGLAREAAAAAVDTPGPLGDKACAPRPAAPQTELLPA